MDLAEDEVLAYLAFPHEHWRQLWSASVSIRRSSSAPTWSGSSPMSVPLFRLVGSVLAEQNDEWAIARRYFSAESLAKLADPESHDPLPAPTLLESAR
jgi:putative transposase